MILPHLYHIQSTGLYDFTSFVSQTEYSVIQFYLICITDRVKGYMNLPHLYHIQSTGLYDFTSFVSQTE